MEGERRSAPWAIIHKLKKKKKSLQKNKRIRSAVKIKEDEGIISVFE